MVVFRMFFTKLRRMVTQLQWYFPRVRVSLAIIGSVLLTLTFLVDFGAFCLPGELTPLSYIFDNILA